MTDKAMPNEPVKIDIISGFLGAGKTTIINKLLEGAVSPAETVLIENEFGEVSIDDELLKNSGMEMKTLSSGCICCTLRGNFVAAIPELIETFHPKRMIIEPTGMASPHDLLEICKDARKISNTTVNTLISVMNAKNIERLIRLNVPAFNMQFEKVSFVVLTHLEELDQEKIDHAAAMVHEKVGEKVPVIAKQLDDIDALDLLSLAEEAFMQSGLVEPEHSSEHDAHEHHEHHHDHGHHHDHDHHHHDSVEGVESKAFFPAGAFTSEELQSLMELFDGDEAGTVLRAKGFLVQDDAGMVLFEQVYGSGSIKKCSYAGDAKFVVIGRDLDEEKLKTALKA